MSETGFFTSLASYTWKRFAGLPINWWYVGVIIILSCMVISWSYSGQTMAGIKNTREAIERAARAGDYQTARRLMEENQNNNVLGADSELEELVYPERKVEREIAKYEELNRKYPGSRDILLNLSKLYKQIEPKSGYAGVAERYWEEARILDPNNEIFTDK